MEYSEDLDRKFRKLGFENYKDFYKSATPVLHYPTEENAIPDLHMLDDIYTDPEDIGYIFMVSKDPVLEEWNIYSISASIQFESERVIEGVIVLSKYYEKGKDQFPQKEEMRKELLEKRSVENAKELQFAIQRYASTVNRKGHKF